MVDVDEAWLNFNVLFGMCCFMVNLGKKATKTLRKLLFILHATFISRFLYSSVVSCLRLKMRFGRFLGCYGSSRIFQQGAAAIYFVFVSEFEGKHSFGDMKGTAATGMFFLGNILDRFSGIKEMAHAVQLIIKNLGVFG